VAALLVVVIRVFADADGLVGFAGLVAAEARERPNRDGDRTPKIPPAAPLTAAAEIRAAAVIVTRVVRFQTAFACLDGAELRSSIARLNIVVSLA
jgi:hypothetical protein